MQVGAGSGCGVWSGRAGRERDRVQTGPQSRQPAQARGPDTGAGRHRLRARGRVRVGVGGGRWLRAHRHAEYTGRVFGVFFAGRAAP